jgi:hypothetical protein
MLECREEVVVRRRREEDAPLIEPKDTLSIEYVLNSYPSRDHMTRAASARHTEPPGGWLAKQFTHSSWKDLTRIGEREE